MNENSVAKTLHVIGILTIIFGIIGSLICGDIFPAITYDYSYYSGYDIETSYNAELAIIGSVASFISGMCFIGFSEIIFLLQQSINKQEAILKLMKDKSTKEKNAAKTILQDIEENLPKI